MLDVAVVGAGKIGSKHARAIEAIPDAHLTHVVDIDADRASELASRVGGSATDIESALAADVVYVCTPDDKHVDVTMRALQAGCHTFVEKPLTTSVDAADTLVKAAADFPTVNCVGHLLRFDTRYHRLRSEVDTIGEICSIDVTRLVPRERARRTGAVSGPAMRLGVHDFDLLQWLTNRSIQRVRALAVDGALRSEGYEIPDVVTVQCELSDGVSADVSVGFALPDSHPGSIVRLEILGTEGVAAVDAGGSELAVWDGRGARFPDTALWPAIDGAPSGALAAIDRAFLAAVRAEAEPPVSFRAGRNAVAVARAVERATASGRFEPVE